MPRHESGLTCTHVAEGLCPACAADYDTDPSAWIEFGDHSAGVARTLELEEEMDNARAAEPQGPPDCDDTTVPF